MIPFVTQFFRGTKPRLETGFTLSTTNEKVILHTTPPTLNKYLKRITP